MSAICRRHADQATRLEEMRALAVSRGGVCLSDAYESSLDALRWRCARGHTWDATPNSIQRGSWCPRCARVGRSNHSIEEMQEIARRRGGRCLSDTYTNVTTKLERECARGHTWFTSPMVVLKGCWCPSCRYMDACVSDEAQQQYRASTQPGKGCQ